MRIAIQNGSAKLEFEGDPEEFDRLANVLEIPTDLLVRARPSVSTSDAPLISGYDGREEAWIEDTPDPPSGAIDVHAVAERLRELEAKSDIDRVTIMAKAAVDAGLIGIDYAGAERLFVDLGERKPTKIRATFQNAKARGLVHSAGRGVWAPTVAGENYARLGHKPRTAKRSASRRSQTSLSPNGAKGGDRS
jgi:hypothetical protein